MRTLWTRLSFAAWLALALHLIAGLAMAIILRQGLDTNSDLLARLRFLADGRILWIVAWMSWNAAALSVLYYYACFASVHAEADPTPSSLPRFAVILSTIGVALDLAAEVLEMGVLPDLAHRALLEFHSGLSNSNNAQMLLVIHRAAVMLTGYAANGLYTISAVLLTWHARRAYPRWISFAGFAVGVAGFTLSGFSLTNSVRGMFWANAALVPALLVWLAGVASSAMRKTR